MRRAEFKYTTLVTKEDDAIVFATYVPKLEITMDIAREMVDNRISFVGNQSHYILIDFTNVRSVTKEARDYMNNPDGGLKGILGGAFLSNNVVATLFVNLYLKVSNPSIPAKFFTNIEDALDWLKKIKTANTQIVKN